MAQRSVKVVGIKRKEPDEHLYVLALIAFARQLAEEQQESNSNKDEKDD